MRIPVHPLDESLPSSRGPTEKPTSRVEIQFVYVVGQQHPQRDSNPCRHLERVVS